MDRKEFGKEFTRLRMHMAPQSEFGGEYFGAFVDSVRMALEAEEEIAEFAWALAAEIGVYGYSDSNFNLDQRYRFMKWMETFEHPYILTCLYVFFETERKMESKSVSTQEVCARKLKTLKEKLSNMTDVNSIIPTVGVLPELFPAYNTGLESFLTTANPFEDAGKILQVALAAGKCTERITSKLIRSVRELAKANVTKSQVAYDPIVSQYGERGLAYLNACAALSTGLISRRKQDAILVRFVQGLLNGGICTQEKDLLEKVYSWRFEQNICGDSTINALLKNDKILPICFCGLNFSDWRVFYDLEKKYENKVHPLDICQSILKFTPTKDEIEKWNYLTKAERQDLMEEKLLAIIYDNQFQASDMKQYEDFYLENEKIPLKDMLAERYAEKYKENIFAFMINKGLWEIPSYADICGKEEDKNLIWLRDYTRCPHYAKAGIWVLGYYEIYGQCPAWFGNDVFCILKESWLMEMEEDFRYRYFYMCMNHIFITAPQKVCNALEKLFYGNHLSYGESAPNMEFFMAKEDLKHFAKFLYENFKEDDNLLRYQMGLEQYEEYKTSQFNQRKIAKLIQDVKAGLSEMLKSEDPIEYIHNNRRKYVYDDIKKRIYAELIEKAIIPHMCQYAIKNGSPIEYAKDMVFMAEQLDEGKQRNILKDMAQLILQF